MPIAWNFTPRQREFWRLFRERRVVAFLGGIRAGKTWIGVRRLIFEGVQRGGLVWCVTPKYTMMGAARRTFEEALLPGMLVEKRETPFPLYRVRRSKQGTFEVEFRSADEPDNLRGPSLTAVMVDEAAQLADEVIVESGRSIRRCQAWDVLLGRTLDTRGPVIVTTTPKGRNWLYESFVLRPGVDYGLVVARTDENPTLDSGAIAELRKQYAGAFGRQELEAEFVAAEGVFFAEWSRDLHVVEPFEVPAGWRWYGAMDDGYVAPYSFGLYAHDPEGTLYRVAESYGTGFTTAEKAEQIARCLGGRPVQVIAADPSMWARKSDTGQSTAEVLQRELRRLMGAKAPGLVKASNDRKQGWARCREWLMPVEGSDGVSRARFKAFASCQHFLRTIPGLIVDPHDVEDVETHGEDHCADEWRYLLMNRPRPKQPSLSAPEPYTGAWYIKQMQRKRLNTRYIHAH